MQISEFFAESSLYRYMASCPDDDALHPRSVRIYDGDTIRLDIHVGFSMKVDRVKCRLWGINAPEVNNPETRIKGLEVRDYLRMLLLGKTLLGVETLKDRTDGLERYIAKVWAPQPDGSMLFVNDHLIEKFPGHVVPFMR